MRKRFSLPVAATAAGGGPTPPPPADTVDNIEHSVRFNSADSAYMSRTPSSAGNRKTWTWSGWVKRSELGSFQDIWGNADTSALNGFLFRFDTADKIDIYDLTTATQWRLVTTQVFRDTSAWYHFVISFDTTNATAGDRVRLYVNGVRIEDFSLGSDPSLNYEGHINNTNQHAIGRTGQYNSFYLSAYLANIQFVDGQALTPSSFGFTDSSGVWQPKAYSGSYGTNGFHLDFADTSSATALGNDVSGNNNDWTPSGLVAGPAYTANSFSTEFDGTGDYLTVTGTDSFNASSGDWTIEGWCYFTNSSNNEALIVGKTSSSDKFYMNYAGSTFYLGDNSLNNISFTNKPVNQWFHLAATKEGSTYRVFINGSLQGSSTTALANSVLDEWHIGARTSQSWYTNGKISNVRVIKGRALYTAAFTPPTTALTATDDTVLLTCQDATVRDNSNIGHSVTANGDVAVVNEGPFNGYSADFTTGGALSIADSTDFTLGTNDFTLEAWCYFTSTSFQLFLGQNDGNVSGSSIDVRYSAGTVTTYAFSGGNSYSATGSAAANVWNHVAWVRDGSTLRLFINGSQTNTSNIGTNSINDSATTFRIGNAASRFSNVRLTNGQALYTADFTPPTADLTTTSQGATASNVKLLTCQNSTFIDNSPSAHTITVNGSAHTVPVNPHTDKYSVTFDGTGDYLNVAETGSEFTFGTGDFTIEFWTYRNNTGPTMYFDWRNVAGNQGARPAIYSYISQLRYYLNGSDQITGTDIALNTWTHVALCRSGTSTKMFVNGTQVGSTYSDVATYLSPQGPEGIYIGAFAGGSYDLNGKISNFRITKGQALYTSNFLPSKEDLTTTSQGATASNVKLLTCQSYKIQDNSPSAHTITVNGDAAPSTVAPFVTSGAGSFDGTGDYLVIPNNSDFAFGTGDFTVEMWAYFQGSGSYENIFDFRPSGQTGNYPLLVRDAVDGDLYYFVNGSRLIDNVSVSNNQWYHIAISREGTTTRFYLDGVLAGSATDSSNYISSNLNIGSYAGGGNYLTGEVSNFRISKGLARYTSNFTPPTEDFDPTDQDTTFLALQGNTLDDLSGNDHAVTANGDAATSTVSPFEPVDGSDAMLDSPTNYGSGDTVRGNYCTLNPLTGSSAFTLTNGNLDVSDSGASSPVLMGTIGVNSGKWYWEVTLGTAAAYAGASQVTSTSSVGFLGATSGQFLYNTNAASSSWIDGSGYNYSTASGAAAGDVIGVALDFDSNEITFYKNGVSQGVFGSNVLGTSTWTPAFKSNVSTSATFNFGQQPFKYPLAGYKSLCSTNLPTPAVADGSTAMDVALYAGNNSTQSISTPNMSPDIVWLKARNTAYHHRLFDVIRGQSSLRTDTTNAEGTSANSTLTSFDSTGFSITNTVDEAGNATGTNYVAWTWDAGSSTVSNTDGTITSQVRANPTAGVSIVTYNGTSNSTIGHGLQAKPSLIIVKNKDNTSSWQVYSEALGATKYLILNLTNGEGTNIDRWNNTEPTSSVFTIGSNAQVLGNCVAYCFAPVEGFSSFGSFTGSTSNTFVYTGMRPRWLMIKRTDTTGNWQILDTEREGYNVDNDPLWANLTDQEGTTDIADILSNGFKMRDGATGDYIYAAFAEHPFKTSRAR